MPFQREVGGWYYKDSCHHDARKQQLLDTHEGKPKQFQTLILEMFISRYTAAAYGLLLVFSEHSSQ